MIYVIIFMIMIIIRRMPHSIPLSWRFLRCPAMVNVAVLQVNVDDDHDDDDDDDDDDDYNDDDDDDNCV